VACGRPSAIRDNFDDVEIGPQWQVVADQDGDVIQQAGALVVAPAPASGSVGWSFVISSYAVNFDQDLVRVEVLEMVDTATDASGFMSLELDSGNWVGFEQRAGDLVALIHIDGQRSVVASVPYSPDAHRWWQLREEGGSVYWETSADGKIWEEGGSKPTPGFAPFVRILLGAANSTSVNTPGQVRFDNLNPSRTAPWCPALQLDDDFADDHEGPQWSASYVLGGCTKDEAGGNAAFALDGSGNSECAYRSATGYDLTGDSITVNVPAITSFYSSMSVFLRASNYLGQKLEMGFWGSNQIHAGAFDNNTTLYEGWFAYDPDVDEWWRIRESGGQILFETGSDNGTWVTRHSIDTPFAVDAMQVGFGVASWAALGGSVGIGVPSYNYSP